MADDLRERCAAWVDAALPLHQDRHALIKSLVDFTKVQIIAFGAQAQEGTAETGRLPVANAIGWNDTGSIRLNVCSYDNELSPGGAPMVPLNNRVELTIGGHVFIPRDHKDWMYQAEAEQFAEKLRTELGLRP